MEVAGIISWEAESQDILALTISARIADYLEQCGVAPTVAIVSEQDIDDAVLSLPISIHSHNLLPRLTFILGILEN